MQFIDNSSVLAEARQPAEVLPRISAAFKETTIFQPLFAVFVPKSSKIAAAAAAWAAASKYIAKVGPWLMAFAPLGTAVGMVYTGRFTAQAYHLEYLDLVKWSKKDKATRGEKVGITLEEYTERMIAYRASIVLTFIGLSSGLGILGAMMIMNSIAMKGLGWTKEKVMDKGEFDDKLKKDFNCLSRFFIFSEKSTIK